jgi:TfoX/Sxy family transcriptional regulator of competence genes
MAYNEELAHRIRQNLLGFSKGMEEKRMFGGIAFLYKGKMCCGVVKDNLMIRVISDKYEKTLENPYARPMDFTGKPMKEFLYVDPSGFESETKLTELINLGIEHAKSKL